MEHSQGAGYVQGAARHIAGIGIKGRGVKVGGGNGHAASAEAQILAVQAGFIARGSDPAAGHFQILFDIDAVPAALRRDRTAGNRHVGRIDTFRIGIGDMNDTLFHKEIGGADAVIVAPTVTGTAAFAGDRQIGVAADGQRIGLDAAQSSIFHPIRATDFDDVAVAVDRLLQIQDQVTGSFNAVVVPGFDIQIQKRECACGRVKGCVVLITVACRTVIFIVTGIGVQRKSVDGDFLRRRRKGTLGEKSRQRRHEQQHIQDPLPHIGVTSSKGSESKSAKL